MRRILFVSSLVTCLALSTTASADAGPVGYGDLPLGATTSPPAKAKRPSVISGRETAPGFFLAPAKDGQRVMVVGDAQHAKDLVKGHIASEQPASTCFSEEHDGRMTGEEDAKPAWSLDLTSLVNVSSRSADNPTGGVTAVHMERVVASGDGTAATLESVDALVDPATRGTRVTGRASLPLKQIGVAPGGGKLFAGREERDAGRVVQFVMLRPEQGLQSQVGIMFARDLDGGIVQSRACTHFRVAVQAKPDGDLALVTMPVLLPSLDGKPLPTLAQLRGGGARTIRATRSAKFAPFGIPAQNEVEERELRVREAIVQLSVSQTSRDKQPIVSVSSHWSSRERVQRIAVPVTTDD